MGRYLCLAVSLALLAGCVPIETVPARDSFGVQTMRADAGTAPASDADKAALAWKVREQCTLGSSQTALTVEPAEANQQIVDQMQRCFPYRRVNLDFVHMDWANLF